MDRIAIHPGEMLAEELEARGLSANALATALRVPANRIQAILKAERAITADTSIRLGRYFGQSPRFWLALQTHHDLALTLQQRGDEIEADVRPAA